MDGREEDEVGVVDRYDESGAVDVGYLGRKDVGTGSIASSYGWVTWMELVEMEKII